MFDPMNFVQRTHTRSRPPSRCSESERESDSDSYSDHDRHRDVARVCVRVRVIATAAGERAEKRCVDLPTQKASCEHNDHN